MNSIDFTRRVNYICIVEKCTYPGPNLKGIVWGRSPLGLDKTEIEPTDFIEKFVSQNSRNIASYF
jgi:hypothetical protein